MVKNSNSSYILFYNDKSISLYLLSIISLTNIIINDKNMTGFSSIYYMYVGIFLFKINQPYQNCYYSLFIGNNYIHQMVLILIVNAVIYKFLSNEIIYRYILK